MGSKTKQISVGTELDVNNANLVTSRKIKTRLARPIVNVTARSENNHSNVPLD